MCRMSAAAVINRRNIDFLLREWLDIDALLARPRFARHSADSIDAILTLAQTLAERELAHLLRISDLNEPSIDEAGGVIVLPVVALAVRLLGEAGFFACVFDEGSGGLHLPHLIHIA